MPTRDQLRRAKDKLAVRAALEREKDKARQARDKAAMLRAKIKTMRTR